MAGQSQSDAQERSTRQTFFSILRRLNFDLMQLIKTRLEPWEYYMNDLVNVFRSLIFPYYGDFVSSPFRLFAVTIGQLLDFTFKCFIQNDLYNFISLYRKMITGFYPLQKLGITFLKLGKTWFDFP